MRKLLTSIFLVYLVHVPLLGQAGIAWVPQVQLLDNNGDPLASGTVNTYVAGTTTNQATYTDFTLGTANANPVVLDSSGRANIWLDESLSYKLVVKNSSGTTIYTADNINSQFSSKLVGLTQTIGTGTAADTKLVFDGAETDWYLGLDDSANDLLIGTGSTVGTNGIIFVDSTASLVGIQIATPAGELHVGGTTPLVIIGDGGAEDTQLLYDGNAQDFYIGLDDGSDDLYIGAGSTVGSNGAIIIDENLMVGIAGSPTTSAELAVKGTTPALYIGDAGAEDTSLVFDGNAQDYYVGLDDTDDQLKLGLGSAVGTTVAIAIDSSADVDILDATLGIGGIDYEFPPDDGDAGEQLQTDGSGTLTWEAASSSRSVKHVYPPDLTPEQALSKMLEVTVYPYRYREGEGTGDLENLYHGVMAEDFPEVMHHGDRILDPLSTFGYTVLAVQALAERQERLAEENRELRQRLQRLERRALVAAEIQ